MRSEDTRWSRRLFRLLLFAYPRDVRIQHGEDMWLTFERQVTDARSRSQATVLRVWRREIVAMFRARRQVRVSAHRTRRTHQQQKPAALSKTPLPKMSLLDFKLGVRMLFKYPGLTIVGGIALASAIAVGAGSFVFVTDLIYPTLPFEGGDRLVSIEVRNVRTNVQQYRVAHDFLTWRAAVESIEDLSAFGTLRRNLAVEDERLAPVTGAAMTASGFRLAQTPALLGRILLPADEQVGAPDVVVLGFDLWQSHFDGDPGVIDRTVWLGRDEYLVVGVMPEGFAFPSNHDFWVPLRLRVADYEPAQGPTIALFGRLAPGVSRSEAQVELTAIGARTAASFPATHEHLRPRLERYGALITTSEIGAVPVYSLNALLFLALLGLVAANVALLVFARTATRESELVVRSALGASRGRIIAQLFAEALVLGGLAAVLGLAAAHAGLGWAVGTFERVEGALPYWFHDGVTPAALLYVAVFTLIGAAVVGIVPALKATGRRARTHAQQASGRTSALRMGGVWTAVIVTQVAFTLVFVRIVIEVAVDTAQISSADVGFPAGEYLSAELRMETSLATGAFTDTGRARRQEEFRRAYQDLGRRVAEAPGVVATTFADQIPGAFHPRGWIEVEGVLPEDGALAHRAQMGSVDLGFFNALDATIVAGREFREADLGSDARVVIVNESFVRAILGGRNAIGRRVRYLNDEKGERDERPAPDQAPGPWYEIIGVVRGPAFRVSTDLPHAGGIYHPLTPTTEPPIRIAVHLMGNPSAFEPTLRSLATAADPGLQLDDVRPMDEAHWRLLLSYTAWLRVVAVAGVLAILLSNAGIYAIMSFAVSRRTREIGIRVALGSDARRIVGAIFSRSLVQVGSGIVVGTVLLVLAGAAEPGEDSMILFAAYVAATTIVCLLACIVPTRRALRIQPTEALRAE